MHWLVTSLPGWLSHPFRVGSSQGRGWPPTKLFPFEPLCETSQRPGLFHPNRARQLGSCRHFPRQSDGYLPDSRCFSKTLTNTSSFNSYRACTNLLVIRTPLATPCSNCCNPCERIGQEQVWNHRSGLIPLPAYSIP